MFHAQRFLKDYHITHWTEGKNVTPGWVNIQCPFCGDTSNHGGINPAGGGYFNCWKCGPHPFQKVIKTITGLSFPEVKEIIKEYTTEGQQERLNKTRKKEKNIIVSLPKDTGELNDNHKKYLVKRKFDPEYLTKEWGIKGTGIHGPYKFRIIAPIYLNNKLVSFQGRDITGKASLRYKACPIDEEAIHHKNILYGMDYVQNKKSIIVEGITDAWRLGHGATATFGTGYSKEQVRFILKNMDYVFLLFDPDDPIAGVKADKLRWELSGLRTIVEMIETDAENDPAEWEQKEAIYIRKQLLNY